ncbi:hypothetical protein CALCODRAFT_519359 [Calocera cornea HHB12733]|uniref:C2H2-type domain-containing protein n=1 Tax=Calocera cornea HHB12733 TaxID=1353952 RepID=A0A165EB14_9BASI|nr:hypothetical protein CALCODRAFT_519359 [Calocera cornea HHB12733]
MSQQALPKLYHCRWDWCRKYFPTSDQLLEHVVEHYANAEPVRAGDIPALRKAEEGWSFEQSFMPDFSPPDMSSITASTVDATSPALVVTETVITTSTTHTSSSVESYPIASTSYRRRPPQPQLVPDDSTATIPRLSPSGDPVAYTPYSPYRADVAVEPDVSMSSEMALDPVEQEQHVEGEGNTSQELGEMEQYVRLSSLDPEPDAGSIPKLNTQQPHIPEQHSQHLARPAAEHVTSSQVAVEEVSQEITMDTEVPTSTLPSEQQRAMEQAEAFAASLVLSSMATPSSSPYGTQYPPSSLNFSSQPQAPHTQSFATQAPLPDSQPFAHTQAPIPDTQPFVHTQAPEPEPRPSVTDAQPSSQLQAPFEQSSQRHSSVQHSQSTQSIEEADESQDDIRAPELGASTQMLFSAVADFLGPAAPASSAPTVSDPAPDPQPQPKDEPESQAPLPAPAEEASYKPEPSMARPSTPPRASSDQPEKSVSPRGTTLISRIYQGIAGSLARSSTGTQSSAGSQPPQSQAGPAGFGIFTSQAPVPELESEVQEEG